MQKNSSTSIKIIIMHDQRDNATNLGTRAFTNGLIQLAQHHFPSAEVRTLYISRYFKYCFYKLKYVSGDKIGIFKKWTRRYLLMGLFLEKVKNYKTIWGHLEKGANYLNNLTQQKSSNVILRKFLSILNKLFVFQVVNQDAFSTIKKADIILVNGHAIVRDHFAERLFVLLFYSNLAKRLNKVVAFVNQTVEIQDPLVCSLVKKVYNELDYIAARDPFSRQRLIDIGVLPEKVNLSSDASFFLQVKFLDSRIERIISEEAIEEGSIGLIVRNQANPDYKLWAETINQIEEAFKKRVIYVTTSKVEDMNFIKEVLKFIPLKYLKNEYDYNEMIGIFKRLEMIISDRFHGAVFSILANTPVIPMKTKLSEKTKGLFEFFDYPIQTLDPLSASNQKRLIEAIRDVYQNYDKCKMSLCNALPRLRKYSMHNIPDITDIKS
ncbi:MAG: polysaccharide pyruvyl transferase family protein [bacterium]